MADSDSGYSTEFYDEMSGSFAMAIILGFFVGGTCFGLGLIFLGFCAAVGCGIVGFFGVTASSFFVLSWIAAGRENKRNSS